jgi:hypothetical protein
MNIQTLNNEVKAQWETALNTYIEVIKTDYISFKGPEDNRDEIGKQVRERKSKKAKSNG